MTTVKKAMYSFGLPRIIIIAFFLLLLVMAAVYDMNIPMLLSDVIRRWGMFGILVLAMVPGIQCGIGPNFGISVGIVGGLLGALISIEMRFYGWYEGIAHNPSLDAFVSFSVAIVLGIFFSSIFGILYGILLNQVKGSEMTVSTYIGFSVIALFNILWLILPFRSGTSIWPIAGEGLRSNISLADDFSLVLNNIWRIQIGNLVIPTGMLLFFFLACFFAWLFTRSRFGMMMAAAGSNPNYAKSAGIDVNKMRILGTTVSMALGGVGIVCYAQSYGFLQLYNGPMMMGFACVASVLIGGGSIGKARIFHVLLGTFLFHGMLAVALPVANEMIPGSNISEVLRVIVSNGIILYALSKAKGGAK